jgi:hypothetical protein
MLHFSDGVSLDTSGPLRAIQLRDGWYVVGEGFSIPVNSKEEAEETIRQMTAEKGDESDVGETK